MKKAKIILKYFDEMDKEIERECISIKKFIEKIDQEIENDWKNFKKVLSITFRVVDENNNTFIKEHKSIKDFKKESVILKDKLN